VHQFYDASLIIFVVTFYFRTTDAKFGKVAYVVVEVSEYSANERS